MSNSRHPGGNAAYNVANGNRDADATSAFEAQRPTDDEPQASEGSRFTYPLPGPGGRLANS